MTFSKRNGTDVTQFYFIYRTSIFDMISAVGGTLGLFTGVSIITFVEVFYWITRDVLHQLTSTETQSHDTDTF
jgi:hypothetical protein